jgi:cation transport regulator ChaC
MDTIRRQIFAARRRLMLQRFGRIATWSLFTLLCVAAIGAAVPKLWAIPVQPDLWWIGWSGGATLLALLVAAIATFVSRPSLSETAIEVDRRFELRERLSSTLALDDQTSQTAMGRALVEDAGARAAKLAIGERFGLRPRRGGLLPLIPAVFLVMAIFIPDATRENEADASVDLAAQQEIQQVKTAAEQLKKRLQQQRRKAATEGLADAEDLFKKLERRVDDITQREKVDKKEALVALNDIKKQLEERRDQLGSPEQMRKALAKMDQMEEGPAEKIAKALEQGDFGDAKEQVKQLAEKLRDGTLTDEEKKQLAEQMKQMEQMINDAVAKHDQEKQKLQDQIEQAKREGRTEDAAKLQQKLNQMQAMDGKMQQLQQMAQQMKAAQQAMGEGNEQEAADALQQMADQLGDMQEQLEQLEDLQDAMSELDQAKDQMSCKQCNGQGCQACQGKFGEKPGSGLGQGQGQGDRPEEETDTGSYDSQVRGQPKQGRAVLAGQAGGENKKGVTRESVRDAVLQVIAEEGDPIEDQALPRNEREHAQQYFDRLREGN